MLTGLRKHTGGFQTATRVTDYEQRRFVDVFRKRKYIIIGSAANRCSFLEQQPFFFLMMHPYNQVHHLRTQYFFLSLDNYMASACGWSHPWYQVLFPFFRCLTMHHVCTWKHAHDQRNYTRKCVFKTWREKVSVIFFISLTPFLNWVQACIHAVIAVATPSFFKKEI